MRAPAGNGRTRAVVVGVFAVAALVVGAAIAADNPSPSVSITAPASGTVVDGSSLGVTVAFAASANDPQEPTGNVTLVELALDGSTVGSQTNPPGTKSGTAAFTVDLSNVANGTHTLVARAHQGNPGVHVGFSSPVTFEVVRADTTPPTISARVDPPANAAGWHTTPPTITFEASDPSGIASLSPPVLVETEGANQSFTGTARDNAGNEASASATVSVDLTPPQLAVLAPLDGATVIGRAVTLRGSASDGVSGLAGVSCNDAAAVVAEGEFSCALTLVDGLNTVTVGAVDVAGNQASTTVVIRSVLPAEAPPAETADVSVTATATPASVLPGGTVTYTIVARNNGPASATNVVVTSSLGGNVSLVSVSSTQGSCSGSTAISCSLGELASGASATVTLVFVVNGPGPAPSVGVGAVQADPVVGNNVSSPAFAILGTQTPPGPLPETPPAPVQGQSAVARPVSGIVLVNGRPLAELGSIPVGARVDTRNGKIELRTTTGVGIFSAGEFRFQQAKARGAQAELRLLANVAKACGKAAAKRSLASTAAPPKGKKATSKKVVTRLWGQSKGARFKTTSRFSSATVRGTVWIVTERCDGSLTTVRNGRVEVRDLVKRKTIVLRPGQSYLARP